MLRHLFLLLFVLADIIGVAQSHSSQISQWVVSKNSNLLITGRTNVNDFSCLIASYSYDDTIVINRSKEAINLLGSIKLDILAFNCHNTMMTKDLRKTLRQKHYPLITIRLFAITKFPTLTSEPTLIEGLVDIELAGSTKRFKVNYQVNIDQENTIHLLGSRDVNFSDFNLEAPKKMGGMVQAKNKIGVLFHLKLEKMPNSGNDLAR